MEGCDRNFFARRSNPLSFVLNPSEDSVSTKARFGRCKNVSARDQIDQSNNQKESPKSTTFFLSRHDFAVALLE